MEDTFNHIDDLIGKCLAGEASPSEATEVEVWAKASQANQKYLDQLKMIFENSSGIKHGIDVDEDQAWKKLKSKIEEKQTKVVPLNAFDRKLFYRIAASVIILFGVGFYFYKSTRPAAMTEVIAANKSVSDTLPDGSDVFLNKQTKLTYHYDKTKRTRIVRLRGEAYFHIKHDEKQAFLIATSGVYIRDIGTSFIVKAYPKSSTIEVVVKEGEVEFFAENNKGIHLHASTKGVYDKHTRKFTVEQPESNELAFKTRLFTFSNKNLGDVIKDINDVYDKKIIISNNLRNCYLTVTFDNESIEEITNVIAETLGLTVKRSGNEIILEGSGCER